MTNGNTPCCCEPVCHPRLETVDQLAQLSTQVSELMKSSRLPDVVTSSRPKPDLVSLRLTLVGTQLRLISQQFDASRTPAS